MKQTRILLVSDVYFPRVNGVSTSIQTFRTSLMESGFGVRLVVPRYGDEPDEAGIVRVAGRKVPGDPEDRLVTWGDMREAVRREAAACDLVHIQTPFLAHYAGLGAAKLYRRPVVLTYHTFFEEYLQHYAPMLPASLLRAAARRMSRSQCNAVDAVIVPSQAMRGRLADYGVERPMHVLPTGIPVDAFSCGDGSAFRARFGIDPSAPMALFVGRVAHEKNIEFLLEVASRVAPRLPGFVLLIAGEGPAMAALKRETVARRLNGSVRFAGYLDRKRELPGCYAAADAFVFASRTETQGLVLLEAMAAGLPVVALAQMGTIDILARRRGAVVPPDCPDGFADELHDLLTDHDRRRALAHEARVHGREWRDSIMADRLASLYLEILDCPRSIAKAPPRAGPEPAITGRGDSALRH